MTLAVEGNSVGPTNIVDGGPGGDPTYGYTGWADIDAALEATGLDAGTYLVRAYVPYDTSTGGTAPDSPVFFGLRVACDPDGLGYSVFTAPVTYDAHLDTGHVGESGTLTCEGYVTVTDDGGKIKIQGNIIVEDPKNAFRAYLLGKVAAGANPWARDYAVPARMFIHRIA